MTRPAEECSPAQRRAFAVEVYDQYARGELRFPTPGGPLAETAGTRAVTRGHGA